MIEFNYETKEIKIVDAPIVENDVEELVQPITEAERIEALEAALLELLEGLYND